MEEYHVFFLMSNNLRMLPELLLTDYACVSAQLLGAVKSATASSMAGQTDLDKMLSAVGVTPVSGRCHTCTLFSVLQFH